MLEDASQASFVPDVVVVYVLVLNEVLVLLVDCIVGQMHAEIVQIAAQWRNVFLSREASKTLFKEKNSDWNNLSDQYVDTQVELQIVN